MNLTDPQKKLAKSLVDKGLGVPAVFFLEAFKPLSLVAQQTLYATSPLTVMSGLHPMHRTLTSVFESRENLDELMLELERLMEAEEQ